MRVGILECKELVQGSVMTIAMELARYNLDLVGMRRWEDNIKMDFRKWDVRAWAGSIWLRIGTGGGHL